MQYAEKSRYLLSQTIGVMFQIPALLFLVAQSNIVVRIHHVKVLTLAKKKGRGGMLCSKCKSNFFLSLQNNISSRNEFCISQLFWTLFLLNILFYSLFLLFRDDISNCTLFIKFIWHKIYFSIKVRGRSKIVPTSKRCPKRQSKISKISSLATLFKMVPSATIFQILINHLQDIVLLIYYKQMMHHIQHGILLTG